MIRSVVILVVLAVLPGSRRSEVGLLARPFLQTALALQQRDAALQVGVPLVNEATRQLLQRIRVQHAPGLEALVSIGTSRQAMAAADVVLTASGTATLEGLLSKRPMVVGYKLTPATYLVARWLRLVKVEHIAMANLLSGERLAPELIQAACEPRELIPAVQRFLDDPTSRQRIAERYRQIHQDMRTDTNHEAATAVVQLLEERGIV